MKRRAALCALLGAALARGPLVRAAERVRIVGLLTQGSGSGFLSKALARHGWIEGRNVRFEVRKVGHDGGGADAGAAELVGSGADVLVGQGRRLVTALSRATRTIPIVCAGISNPVGEGLARSLQQPGMNVTGLSFGLPEAAALQIGALRALLPGLKRLAVVSWDYRDQVAPEHASVAAAAGISTEIVIVKSAADAEAFLLSMRRPANEAAWFAFLPRGVPAEAIAAAALRGRIATHGMNAKMVSAGMLMSYWIVHPDLLGRVAALVDKVLRGEDPARIPFELPDKTEFALNRATARAIGVHLPDAILLRATEVFG